MIRNTTLAVIAGAVLLVSLWMIPTVRSQVMSGASASLYDLGSGIMAFYVHLGSLISGEDQTNNLLMTSGGAVRGSNGNMQAAAVVAADGTPIAGITGSKTVSATLTCGASDCTGTVEIYGSALNTQAAGTGELLCTLTFTAAATQTKTCPTITAAFLYFWSDITAMAGTGESFSVTMMY